MDMTINLKSKEGREKYQRNLCVTKATIWKKYKYLSANSFFLVARAPNNNTETRYIAVVVRVAASVPMGIERWVSFSEADRFEPAIIPVTAGKKRPTNALKKKKNCG